MILIFVFRYACLFKDGLFYVWKVDPFINPPELKR